MAKLPKTICQAVEVRIIATQVDDCGRPVGEQISQPVKVFRASARDFWAEIDTLIAVAQQRPAPAPPAPDPAAPARNVKR